MEKFTNLFEKNMALLFALLYDLQYVSVNDKDNDKKAIDISSQIRSILLDLSVFPIEVQKEYADMMEPWYITYRDLLQKIEYKYELYLFSELKNNNAQLNQKSPRMKTYQKMVMNELEMMNIYTPFEVDKRLLFVGGGPMPISAIYSVLINPLIKIDVLDKESEAVMIAREVVKELRLENRITILDACAVEDFQALNTYKTIHMACMVGSTEIEKKTIYQKISRYLPKDKVIFARIVNAHTFSALLYSPLPFEQLKDYYSVEKVERIDRDAIVWSCVLKRL